MVACGSLHPLSVASLSFYSYAFLFLTYSALGVALLIKWSRKECSKKKKKQRNKAVSGQKPKNVKKKKKCFHVSMENNPNTMRFAACCQLPRLPFFILVS